MRRYCFLTRSKFFTLCATACLATACSKTPEVTDHQTQWLFFGTVIDVEITATQAKFERTAKQLEQLFSSLHHELHPWNPGPLNDVNKAISAGESHTGTPHIRSLITLSKMAKARSQGYFDPSIGLWIKAWNFHDQTKTPKAPTSDINSKPRIEDIAVTHDQISSTQTTAWLDFGGIAKGYAGQLALEILKNNNINHATINMGGDIIVLQRETDHYRAGIRTPMKSSPLVIELNGPQHVFTSGGQARHSDDATASHIFDPTSGKPVYLLHSITVIDRDPVMADALATGIYAAGSQWAKVAKGANVTWIAITRDNQCLMNPPAQKLLPAETSPQCSIIE